ncbi:MAG: thiamine phosphate synthase [Clostridiales bacterium]|nr:thiamine phosphate synthase [Eubacterium sp.]MDD7349346.1 thiamine phosphate synthase [Clostridiales bacterium]MDY3774236.1 thiamine phosphate synthase [Eubacterium sp.]
MKPRVDYTLYLCTDRELMSEDTLEKSVELAIQGGVTVVQLREKDCSGREFLQVAREVKQITDAYEIPLIINDRIDIAMAVDADGVHLGQSDIPAHTARELLGPDKIIGVSAYNKELAVEAQKEGADYLGVGDIFGTSTKAGTHHVEIDTLSRICQAVKIPVVAIGGINLSNVTKLAGTGIQGTAVISAIIASKNITEAATKMLSLLKNEVIVNSPKA